MLSILDQILENNSSARVVGENHDTSKINYGGDDAINRASQGGGRPSEPWDASEYRMTLAQAQAKWDAAQTPEGKAKVIEELRARALQRASLDTSNGRVNVMVAGKLPWHGLGVNVDKATTSAQAIQLAGLNWSVVKKQLYTNLNGNEVIATDTYGMIREDNGHYLGTVGSRYNPIQNIQGFDFLDGVLAEFGARYESAGSLYAGEKVWMLAKMPEQSFTINGGDQVDPYVIFENCHDGTGAAFCYPTTVRVVCANTFRVSGKERGKGLSIRHTGNVKDKLEIARNALGFAVKGIEQFKDDAETMYRKPIEIKHYANDVLDAVLEVTQADALKGADALAATLQVTEANRELARKSIAKKIERRGEILDDILERYESERCGIGSIRGTAWAAFNAVTEHADHAKVGRQASDLETRASRRFESTLTGDADDMKQVAYLKALAV
jgi:phage/plasmid-like protein (TIGR03299 family)